MFSLAHLPTITDHGVITHVLVPIGIYQQLTGEHPDALQPPSADDVNAAIAVLNDPRTAWHDADAILQQFVREGIEQARRTRDITQAQLGSQVGLSQPQISRIEKNPDAAPLGILRRIAEVLAASPPTQATAKP